VLPPVGWRLLRLRLEERHRAGSHTFGRQVIKAKLSRLCWCSGRLNVGQQRAGGIFGRTPASNCLIVMTCTRHTAASLMFDADVDIKIVQEVLEHSTSVITRDTYTHVRRRKHRDAAERTVALLPGSVSARETGS
jgi:integrase